MREGDYIVGIDRWNFETGDDLIKYMRSLRQGDRVLISAKHSLLDKSVFEVELDVNYKKAQEEGIKADHIRKTHRELQATMLELTQWGHLAVDAYYAYMRQYRDIEGFISGKQRETDDNYEKSRQLLVTVERLAHDAETHASRHKCKATIVAP